MRLARFFVDPAPSMRCCGVALGICFAAPAFADVVLGGQVGVGIAYTDNLSLTQADEESQRVYQLIPEFTLTQESTRFTTNMAYRVEAYKYVQRDDQEVFQIYDSAFQAALDPDNFFLDFAASRDQALRSPEAPIARSTLPLIADRVDRDDYEFGPSYVYDIGTRMTARGTAHRDWVKYQEDPTNTDFVSEYVTDTVEISLDNYREQAGLAWAVHYDTESTDYDLPVRWEYRQAGVELGTWVSEGRLRLFVAGGQESAWDDPFDASLADGYWEAGAARTFGEQFSGEFVVGERSFGRSARAALNYEFSRGRAEFLYTKEPTATGRDPFQNYELGNALLQNDLDDFLERPGSAERYISERLQGLFTFELRRLSVSLMMTDETRDERTRLDGTPLEEEHQLATYFAANWELGSRTSLVLRGENIIREFAADRKQTLHLVSFGARYSLGRLTGVQLLVTRTKEASENSVTDPNYTAGFVSLLLTRAFQ